MIMQTPARDDNHRIHQRGGELGPHLRELFKMVGHAPEHVHQRAALLAGLHHVDIQLRKHTRLPGHRRGQPLSLRHILLELPAHVRRNALGFQIRHAVERGGQRHSCLKQVGKLLRERGQLLQLRLAPLLQPVAQRFRQEPRQIHFLSRAARGGRGGLAGVHGDGEQAEPLDLGDGGGPVGGLQNALDHFAGALAGLVGKLRHNVLYLKPFEAESFKAKGNKNGLNCACSAQ